MRAPCSYETDFVSFQRYNNLLAYLAKYRACVGGKFWGLAYERSRGVVRGTSFPNFLVGAFKQVGDIRSDATHMNSAYELSSQAQTPNVGFAAGIETPQGQRTGFDFGSCPDAHIGRLVMWLEFLSYRMRKHFCQLLDQDLY